MSASVCWQLLALSLNRCLPQLKILHWLTLTATSAFCFVNWRARFSYRSSDSKQNNLCLDSNDNDDDDDVDLFHVANIMRFIHLYYRIIWLFMLIRFAAFIVCRVALFSANTKHAQQNNRRQLFLSFLFVFGFSSTDDDDSLFNSQSLYGPLSLSLFSLSRACRCISMISRR